MNEPRSSGEVEAPQPSPSTGEAASPAPDAAAPAQGPAPAAGATSAPPRQRDADADSDADAEPDTDAEADEYADLFAARSFGGEFIWAEAPGYVAKILRVKADQNVIVSTQGRRDMVVMLTGGRAVLEIKRGAETEHVELAPAEPHAIRSEQAYRLLALSETELFTIYTPL
ncbi:MAG: hypothetical protein B7733_04085 [Myxococcales bacterium FL481]|nr:MAG: hypothetical protein B7733_04085 [Myxococcales bacterium FL481]